MATANPTNTSSSSSSSSSEEEIKTRIITHMNRDHARELSHYLRHFSHISPSAASNSPAIKDVSLHSLTITTTSGSTTISHSVPFSPPLTSWSDVRPRLIAMDATARAALGISDTYLTKYTLPEGFDNVVFGGVVFYFTCFAALPWIVRGSPAWDLLTAVFPGGPEWFRWVVKAIAVPVMCIHVGEVVLLDRRRMHRHGVQRWSSLWWKWSLSCFFEGVTAWRRIDRILAEKQNQKEAKKHST